MNGHCYPMGIHGIGGLGSIGAPAPFLYIPDLAPVGSKSSYFPRDVENDAAALNFLGFLSNVEDANRLMSQGSQSVDMANESGAWDPSFKAGVTRFQAAKGLTVDGWIGPNTRTAIALAVTQANAAGLGGGVVPTLPPQVIPVTPGQVPQKPNPTPPPGILPAKGGDAPADMTDDLLMYGGIAAGVVAVGGLLWWALSK